MAGLSGRKILVTGGAGFIGSHLVLELLKLGAIVFVIDIEIKNKSYFASKKLRSKVNFKILDIREKSKLLSYFEKHNFNYVIHLAAEPLVGKGYEDPYATFETNIMGTINVLEAVRKNRRIKGLIVASSDKAYGKTKKKYKEDSPLRGDHPYDVSKSCVDLICHAYYKTYGLPVVITRFGNVYGEGDLHFDRIIPGICEAIIRNKTLKIRSNGKYVRDYLYVEDVVDGYLFLASKVDYIKGEAFNFSSNDNLSVLDVIKTAEKSLGQKIKYVIKNTEKNEIPYQHLDNSKVKKLGWVADYSLKTTLPSILEWYKKNYGGSK